MIELADSHGHLTMVFEGGEMKGAPRAPNAAEVKELVNRARDAGVTRILVPEPAAATCAWPSTSPKRTRASSPPSESTRTRRRSSTRTRT